MPVDINCLEHLVVYFFIVCALSLTNLTSNGSYLTYVLVFAFWVDCISCSTRGSWDSLPAAADEWCMLDAGVDGLYSILITSWDSWSCTVRSKLVIWPMITGVVDAVSSGIRHGVSLKNIPNSMYTKCN